ncbi:chimeric ERCC6-PGBD3 protein [Trichonephila clavipes]|nr:chimeric ERCC6-PGBD3 protein [Trichonephila clavipes]
MENQLVLLKDLNTKPLDWPMGRILEVFSSSDGLVRVVNVKTSTGHQSTCTVRKGCIDKPPLESDVVLKKKERGSFDYQINGNGNIICRWHYNSVVTVVSSGDGVNALSGVDSYSQTKKEISSPAAEHDKSVHPVYKRCRSS